MASEEAKRTTMASHPEEVIPEPPGSPVQTETKAIKQDPQRVSLAEIMDKVITDRDQKALDRLLVEWRTRFPVVY